MAQSVTLVTVFVASPSDVREERDAIERAVKELNLTIAPSRNARVEVVRWETYVRPSVASDPQSAINNQVGASHDIVVGIFWGRVGTPTPRAESGTLEELDVALRRWEADNSSVEVMIYFKDDGIPPSQMDINQLSRLGAFKESLSKRGVLYKQVAGREFENQIRIDLAKSISHVIAHKAGSPSLPSPGLVSAAPHSDSNGLTIDEDEGIEDLLAQSTADLEQAAAIMGRITALTDEATAAFSKHNPSLIGPSRREGIEGIASALQSYAEKLVQETGQLGFYQDRALRGLARSVIMAAEDGALGQNERTILLPNLSQSAATLDAFHNSLKQTRLILSKMPRIKRSLNVAKRSALDAIDLLLSKLDAARRMHASILETLSTEARD